MIDRSSSPIVDFLQRSLVGGAIGVPELEVKARAAGLLRERQQIQHAKAFKKAKKALGIRSIRNGFGRGGKWAWVMLPQAAIESGSVANSHPGTKEQPSIDDTKLADGPPALSESRGIVQQWIEGVQRLDYVQCPAAVPHMRWQLFLGDCHSFLSSSENWAERAAMLGWDDLALFGCHRTRPLEHLGSAGLLWVLTGGKLVELHRNWAVIERAKDGPRHIHHRTPRNGANVTLPWSAPLRSAAK